MAGTACVRLTLQLLEPPGPKTPGLQATLETRTGASRPIVAVCELLPRVAVKVALWLLAIEGAAVALNVAVVAPAATVTDASPVSEVLLLATVTLDPPVGAVWVSVTVHVLTALCPRLVGLHATPETSSGARRLVVAVCELLPRVAVTVAFWLLAIEAAAVALNVAVVAPAATVTDAGTESEALLLASVTPEPPAGAGWVNVTVHVLIALCPRLVGLQTMPETRTGASRLIVAVFELVPRVVVTVAFWLLAIEAAAVALKVAVVAPAVTVTDAGTESDVLLLARAMPAPPAGAAWVNVTVQVLTALCPRLVGLQASEETSTGATRVTAAVADFVGSATLVAVTVTVCEVVMIAGAVYNPAALIVPRLGVRVQVTGPPPGAPIKDTVLEANVVGIWSHFAA
jgi:hypothetical protein